MQSTGTPLWSPSVGSGHRGAVGAVFRLGLVGFGNCDSRAPERTGSSSCGPRASVAPRHVGSSWTKNRTYVPCIGRRTPVHCIAREVLILIKIWHTKLIYKRLLLYIFSQFVLKINFSTWHLQIFILIIFIPLYYRSVEVAHV